MTDKKKHTPMMEQYLKIKEEHKGYILFYRVGDFYEMFFDDALTASKVLGIALTKKKEQGEEIPMCGVPAFNYEPHLSKLVSSGFKVAFCEQTEDPKEAKKRGGITCVNRDVIRIFTPGTITEDDILKTNRNNYLLCIAPDGKNQYALAWTDISTGEFSCESIKETQLEETAFRLCPSEILLPDTLSDNKRLSVALGMESGKFTYLPVSRYAFSGAEVFLKQLFQVDTLDSFGDFSQAEIIAAGVLADYINLTQKGKIPSLSLPNRIKDNTFMQIDASTRKGLEIFEGYNEQNTKNSTLINILDKTVTGPGGRLLNADLNAPLLSSVKINDRLSEVEFFVNNNDVKDKIRKILSGSGDIERSMTRISLGRANPIDLQVVKDVLSKAPVIANILYFKQDFLPPSLFTIINELGTHSDVISTLKRALKSELPNHLRDGYFIADGYSAELDRIRQIKNNAKSYINRLQLKYAEMSNVPGLKICNNNVIGYYIEVNSKYAGDMLKAAHNGEGPFIHRQSLAGSSRFITTELTELEEEINSSESKELALEYELFDELCKIVLATRDSIFQASKALARIDVATALAEVAQKNNYCRPIIDDSDTFEVIKGRHPVVEIAAGKDFVSNDCLLKGDKDRLWLITGPNMAGKSTFLRQNALMAIMAQAGSFVPAESAHIGIVDKIFSRIGASDNLTKGQSTFMVEMVETAAILNQATEKSFVILDEIGRGTSTFDGLSIAWAILEALHNTNKCRGLFATHYHELAALGEVLPALSLHSMKTKEWKGNVVFMYEIEKGKADRSYGIHVAKLAGLPKPVIKRAQEVLCSLESKKNQIDDILGELPLFSFAAPTKDEKDGGNDEQEKNSPKTDTLYNMLLSINADELTPIQALNELYRLIAAAKELQ